MAMSPDEYERWYERTQRARKQSNAPAWIGLALAVCVAVLIGVTILVDYFPRLADTRDGLIDTVGKQATHVPRGDLIPAIPPIPGIAQNAATADAMYRDAVDAANMAPLPNIGQDAAAPVIAAELPSSRTHNVETAPTAEPRMQPVSDAQTGERAIPINIQQTQQCKHGQAWTERGCKNPTPIR